jgi:spermidine synthase
VIISEPSNPWLAGPSDLFTLEYFSRAAQSLHPGGMMCQWAQLYALSPENLLTILRTFIQVFPNTYLVTSPNKSDILLLGAVEPFSPSWVHAWQTMQRAEIKDDLSEPRLNISTIFHLAATVRMGPAEVKKMAGTGSIITDDHPVIAYKAPRDIYVLTEKPNSTLIAQHALGIGPYFETSQVPSQDEITFMEQLAEAYRKFLGDGNEAYMCQQIAARMKKQLIK